MNFNPSLKLNILYTIEAAVFMENIFYKLVRAQLTRPSF